MRVYAFIVSRTADRICKPGSRFRCRHDLNKSTLFQKSAWNHAYSRSSKFRKLRHAIRPSRFHLALYSELCSSRFVRLCHIVGGSLFPLSAVLCGHFNLTHSDILKPALSNMGRILHRSPPHLNGSGSSMVQMRDRARASLWTTADDKQWRHNKRTKKEEGD